jgi:hypothetical protein
MNGAGLASLNAFAVGLWDVGGSIYGAQSPEPGTLLMFGSGIICLTGILRRKISLQLCLALDDGERSQAIV